MDLGADTLADVPVRHAARRSARRWSPAALLAFALSFDEIIVTTFTSGAGTQTLPIWIFANYSRPNQLPLVNVASVLVLAALDHPGLHRGPVLRSGGGRRQPRR